MRKRKVLFSLIIGIVLLGVFLLGSPQTVLKYKSRTYDSLLVEIMDVPKDTTIEDQGIGKSLMEVLHIEEWDKYKNFGYKFAASRIIILKDGSIKWRNLN